MRFVALLLVTVFSLAGWIIARESTSLEQGEESSQLNIPANQSQESRRDAGYERIAAADSDGQIREGAESVDRDVSPSVVQRERAVASQEGSRHVQYESAVADGSRGETPSLERSSIEQSASTRGRIAALEVEIESLPENGDRRRVLEELLETSKAAIADLMVAGLSFDDAERIVVTANDNYFSCMREARAAADPGLVDQVYFENCALIMLQQTGLAEFPTTSN